MGTAGLGANKSNPYIANPTTEERRSKITETFVAQREEEFVRHASCLARQGRWTHWDNVIPFDLSWSNLIYGPGPRIISFVLNAQINSVRNPRYAATVGLHSVSSVRHLSSGEVYASPCAGKLQIRVGTRKIHMAARLSFAQHRKSAICPTTSLQQTQAIKLCRNYQEVVSSLLRARRSEEEQCRQ